MKTASRFLSIALLLAALAPAVPAAAGVPVVGADGRVHRFSLLVGYPGDQTPRSTSGVLIVPGTVIPLGTEPVGKPVLAKGGVERADVLGDLAEKLRQTVRLDRIKVLYDVALPLNLNAEKRLTPPSPDSKIDIRVRLVGWNDHLATYHVAFASAGKALTDSNVSVPLGRRAIVGGLNGDEAPYLFLVVEPALGTDVALAAEDANVTRPQILQSIAPVYTEEAKAAKLEGEVVLAATLGEDGLVHDVKVVQGLGKGLAESAVAAVQKWRFRPALDADRNPVAVVYTLTVRFRLDDKDKAPKP